MTRALLVALAAAGVLAAAASAATELPGSVAALGDSLTRGYGVVPGRGEVPEASYATGSDPRVRSLALRLQRLRGVRVYVGNDAWPGATIADLEAQARAAVAQRPAFVVVLIGGVDVCLETPPRAFAARARRALVVLARGLPHARVLVLSIPDLVRNALLFRHRRQVVEFWDSSGACPTVLDRAWSRAPGDVARRARAERLVRAYNDALAAACAAPGCTFDGGAVYRTRFTRADFSEIDHVHLSRRGQARLAAVAWRASGLG